MIVFSRRTPHNNFYCGTHSVIERTLWVQLHTISLKTMSDNPPIWVSTGSPAGKRDDYVKSVPTTSSGRPAQELPPECVILKSADIKDFIELYYKNK